MLKLNSRLQLSQKTILFLLLSRTCEKFPYRTSLRLFTFPYFQIGLSRTGATGSHVDRVQPEDDHLIYLGEEGRFFSPPFSHRLKPRCLPPRPLDTFKTNYKMAAQRCALDLDNLTGKQGTALRTVQTSLVGSKSNSRGTPESGQPLKTRVGFILVTAISPQFEPKQPSQPKILVHFEPPLNLLLANRAKTDPLNCQCKYKDLQQYDVKNSSVLYASSFIKILQHLIQGHLCKKSMFLYTKRAFIA